MLFFVLACVIPAFVVSVGCVIGRDYLHAWLGAHVLRDFRLRMFVRITL